MEAGYSSNPKSQKRRGFVLAAGITAIVAASSVILYALLIILIACIDLNGAESFITGVLILLVGTLGLTAGCIFVSNFSKLSDGEFNKSKRWYSIWAIVLVIAGGVVAGILAIIPLFDESSFPSKDDIVRHDIPSIKNATKTELQHLEEMQAGGLLTHDEYISLVIKICKER